MVTHLKGYTFSLIYVILLISNHHAGCFEPYFRLNDNVKLSLQETHSTFNATMLPSVAIAKNVLKLHQIDILSYITNTEIV